MHARDQRSPSSSIHAHPGQCRGISTNVEDYFLTRRQMLSRLGMGLGAVSLAHLLDPRSLVAAGASPQAPAGPLAPRPPHFPGKAKSVIHIFAAGAPSQMDTWDPKPTLNKMDGKPINGEGTAMGSPFAFSRHGQSGLEASELFAKTAAQMIQNIRTTYVSSKEQRRQIDLIQQLNEIHAENLQREEALESRIQAYEMAFRMQAEALDVFDVSKESADTLAAYGPGEEAKKLLIARRLVERGVRFVQVFHTGWDHHSELRTKLPEKTREIDQPLAALLHDLKQRGLLDSTLVVWGGEFGRKPTRDPTFTNPGRDHNAQAFTVLLAGGGVKGGIVHGTTDEFSLAAVSDKVHTHDLHATILHCLGLDHERLTFRHNGRDFRLTDVAGQVVKPILA